ncbi:MAG: cysteine desulfurase family protein [Gemmatimonadaceae bacterium]
MAHSPIYLDNAATTPVRPEVFEAMRPFFGPKFGNPSSLHSFGREARVALDEARERLAVCLGAHPDEVSFNSCGTEGDNTAVLCLWHALRESGRNAVVISSIEHKAVLAAAHEVAHEGGEERLLAVDSNGVVVDSSFDSLVRDDVAVTSVMWVNNETGVIQDIPELARRAKEHGSVFHTDAVQGFGKVVIDARTQPFDLLSITGHKIGAPKGIGALFIRRGTPFEPLIRGGSQDRGRRAGTENVAFVVALATAAELAVAEREKHWQETEHMRDRLQALLLEAIPDAIVHSRSARRAPHVLNISVPGTDNESMLMALDLRGIACSGGSACQSGSLTPSHVLEAMGVDITTAGAAIRMSFGSINTDADVDRVVEVFPKLVARARTVH